MSRGRGFSQTEVESLLELIEEKLPIGQNEWDWVLMRHVSRYPENERTRDSIKRKFASLYNSRKPTGDPTCPPTVRKAKQLYNLIKERQDYSDCEESMGSFPPSSVGQPEEEEENEDLNNSQMNDSTVSDAVDSSVTSSGRKRSAEGIQIRIPRARKNDDKEDNSMKEMMQFMMMSHNLESQRHKERMELEDRRDARHTKMMEMMMMSMMRSSMSSNHNSPNNSPVRRESRSRGSHSFLESSRKERPWTFTIGDSNDNNADKSNDESNDESE